MRKTDEAAEPKTGCASPFATASPASEAASQRGREPTTAQPPAKPTLATVAQTRPTEARPDAAAVATASPTTATLGAGRAVPPTRLTARAAARETATRPTGYSKAVCATKTRTTKRHTYWVNVRPIYTNIEPLFNPSPNFLFPF